jgi:hypothetical protein
VDVDELHRWFSFQRSADILIADRALASTAYRVSRRAYRWRIALNRLANRGESQAQPPPLTIAPHPSLPTNVTQFSSPIPYD